MWNTNIRLDLRFFQNLHCFALYVMLQKDSTASPLPSFHSHWAHSASLATTLANFVGLPPSWPVAEALRTSLDTPKTIMCVGLTMIMHSILPPLPTYYELLLKFPRLDNHTALGDAVEGQGSAIRELPHRSLESSPLHCACNTNLQTNFQSIYISILGAPPRPASMICTWAASPGAPSASLDPSTQNSWPQAMEEIGSKEEGLHWQGAAYMPNLWGQTLWWACSKLAKRFFFVSWSYQV